MTKTSVNTKNLLKFILGSAFGALMFLVPIPYNDSFTTLLEFCKNFLKNLFGGSLIYFLTSRSIQFAVTLVLDVLIINLLFRSNVFKNLGVWPPESTK